MGTLHPYQQESYRKKRRNTGAYLLLAMVAMLALVELCCDQQLGCNPKSLPVIKMQVDSLQMIKK